MAAHKKDRWFLAAILLAALAHGLIYLSLVPPWQHYDEPNHFEYAWLIAHRNQIPEAGDYDQEMRRETARSMIVHGFFRDMDFLPDLAATDEPIYIGTYSQVSTPPFYYLLVSVPLRMAAGMDITSQLYVGRGVSL
ncbi:MAG: hypothetical protein L0Z70_10380, partial [Chloroflexi bacterium]|nr:hypothetical protein [Chloroflexota bacterium]